jgi:hypothetical protein
MQIANKNAVLKTDASIKILVSATLLQIVAVFASVFFGSKQQRFLRHPKRRKTVCRKMI